VTVSNLAVDAGTVTFNVQWTNDHAPDFVWSDTVWVFVDYNNNGVMERLPVTGASASAGTVSILSGNTDGAWIIGDARTQGNFSATVTLLTAIKDVGGACVYGSNYPPVGKYTSATEISFTGTPGYDLVFVGGATTHTESSPYTVPSGSTVQSFTDKTGAPGKLGCIPSTTFTLMASASTYCTGSTVTFALSNTTSGRTYWLYKGTDPVNALTTTGGAATFTGAFAGAGVYTAQVIAEGGNCAAVMTGTHTVSENPVPTIARSGGNASQTVNQNAAITTITYTASNATGISRSGSLPTGVSGSATANAATYTIGGTPTSAAAAGTYNYTVTAANTNGCPSASISGAITVNAGCTGGSDFCTASTWSMGGYTWSDRVVAKPSGCSQVTTLSTTASISPPAQYKIYSDNDVEHYYYTITCALKACPSGWSLPTLAQFTALVNATNYTDIVNIWGYGGIAVGGTVDGVNTRAQYWSSSEPSYQGTASYSLYYNNGDLGVTYNWKYDGFQVRCVK
jgi:hypothetical protein